MWELTTVKPVKLIVGILASDEGALERAVEMIEAMFGKADLKSEVWPFIHTNYYADEMGENVLKQFVTIEKLIHPERIAKIKHQTNKMEMKLAKEIDGKFSRPVNIDPGYIESAKLVLATTKNFSHRIYIGKNMWAEVTLVYNKGKWEGFKFTFPDHKDDRYHGFFSKVREKLKEQLKSRE